MLTCVDESSVPVRYNVPVYLCNFYINRNKKECNVITPVQGKNTCGARKQPLFGESTKPGMPPSNPEFTCIAYETLFQSFKMFLNSMRSMLATRRVIYFICYGVLKIDLICSKIV